MNKGFQEVFQNILVGLQVPTDKLLFWKIWSSILMKQASKKQGHDQIGH